MYISPSAKSVYLILKVRAAQHNVRQIKLVYLMQMLLVCEISFAILYYVYVALSCRALRSDFDLLVAAA